ncbi:amidohydrolase [Candidatus Bathyarchaeota archaeon]|nr:amidohydrolase [Candidatus Bathyarchaeota archaeon]MBS7630346.1 amidohydrolase [Candidatus Bathyarchaeota archaeon]
MLIDAHMHLGKYGERDFEERLVGISAEQILEVLEHNGVDKAVVVPMSSSLKYMPCIGKAVERHSNLIGLIWIDPRKFRRIDNILKLFSCGQFHGFKLRPESEKYNIGNINLLEPLMKAAEKLDAPVYIHSSQESPLSSPLLIARLADFFPRVTIIMGHMGGCSLEAFLVAEKHPNIFLETSGVRDPRLIQYAVNRLGAERVLFGSDYPYLSLKKEKAKIECLKLPEEDKRLIMGRNATRIFEL